jgi:hypothetical protein
MPDSNCACRIGLNAARCFKGHFIVADHYRVIHRPRTTPRPAEEIIRSDTGSETGSIQVAARRQIGPRLKPGTFPETPHIVPETFWELAEGVELRQR